MTTLRTFRAASEEITTDPSERTDYDQTSWVFHAATGLELSKTYADGSVVAKTYDAYNRLATETDARGNVKTHSYEHAPGLQLGTTYTLPSHSSNGAAAGLLQPIQWSSEFNDTELGRVYYNWRYYNAMVGRWNRRDPEKLFLLKDNDYGYLKNSQYSIDVLGLGSASQKARMFD